MSAGQQDQATADQTFDTRPIVISGPSGVGKNTIIKRLFAEFPARFGYSVSHTTRAPRPGERDGLDYHFTSRAHFETMAAAGAFVEHAVFGGNRYGTSFAAVAAVAAAGRVCVLDIELEGVKQLAAAESRQQQQQQQPFGRPRFLFLAPPSIDVLERRLRARATDDDDAIRRRLDQARVEMDFALARTVHERIVVNDDLDAAYEEVRDFIVGPASS